MDGFWVKVYYDDIPSFCKFCSHIGHAQEDCKRRMEKEKDAILVGLDSQMVLRQEVGHLQVVRDVTDKLPAQAKQSGQQDKVLGMSCNNNVVASLEEVGCSVGQSNFDNVAESAVKMVATLEENEEQHTKQGEHTEVVMFDNQDVETSMQVHVDKQTRKPQHGDTIKNRSGAETIGKQDYKQIADVSKVAELSRIGVVSAEQIDRQMQGSKTQGGIIEGNINFRGSETRKQKKAAEESFGTVLYEVGKEEVHRAKVEQDKFANTWSDQMKGLELKPADHVSLEPFDGLVQNDDDGIMGSPNATVAVHQSCIHDGSKLKQLVTDCAQSRNEATLGIKLETPSCSEPQTHGKHMAEEQCLNPSDQVSQITQSWADEVEATQLEMNKNKLSSETKGSPIVFAEEEETVYTGSTLARKVKAAGFHSPIPKTKHITPSSGSKSPPSPARKLRWRDEISSNAYNGKLAALPLVDEEEDVGSEIVRKVKVAGFHSPMPETILQLQEFLFSSQKATMD